MANTLLKREEDLARSKIGYREGPKNNENMFGAWFGMNFVPWCAIFQSWLSFYSETTYLDKPFRFASTIAARDNAKKNKRWVTTPTVGTVAMMGHTDTTGHVGYVIYILRRDGELIVGTIEGNTNDQGAREGNGVWLRERSVSSWDGYIVLDQTFLNDAEETDVTPDEHKWLEETWNRVKNLESVANRDIDTLRPLIVEAIDLIKNSPTHGAVGEVDPNAVVDESARRLKE